MWWAVLIVLAVLAVLLLTGVISFKSGKKAVVKKQEEKKERKEEVKEAMREVVREVSGGPAPASQPAPAVLRYPSEVPPWPGDIHVSDYDIHPVKSKIYVQPSVILNDGIMRARVFVQGYTVDGEPAVHAPGIFIHNGPDDYVFGPGIEPERAEAAGNKKYMKMLSIEGDVDDGFSPYTKHGFWLDNHGQWEGFITLRSPVEGTFITSALHMDVGGRELDGPGSSIIVQFRPVGYFENNPKMVEYWEDVIDEVHFESLARSLYDKYGKKSGELPNPDPEG